MRPGEEFDGIKTPSGSLRDFSMQDLEIIFDILGLTKNERKVMISASGSAKTITMLARHTKIPRSSIQDIVKRMEKRRLLQKVEKLRWRSDVRKSIRELSQIAQHVHNPHVLNMI